MAHNGKKITQRYSETYLRAYISPLNCRLTR